MNQLIQPDRFTVTVEVVPPAGGDAEPLLAALQAIASPQIDGFSVASNPVAKPRMSALALSALIQGRTATPAILHCTTRDHNRLSTQGLLWGARALGITTVLAATGDYVALGDRARTTTVRDVAIHGLVRMAREAELYTGVVLDPRPETKALELELRRLVRKVGAGAQFVVTQPVYEVAGAVALAEGTRSLGIPVLLGILPLRTARHAEFLDRNVAGISVPAHVQVRMEKAADPAAEGISMAREMLRVAQDRFAGACVMPPFSDYSVVHKVLAKG
jgi:methylenetetrahydrofolate reductase (NADPH)